MQFLMHLPLNLRVRSLPLFAAKGWKLLSWSAAEHFAIKFRSSRTILPAAVQALRDMADDSVFLMQSSLTASKTP
jgi:hypothetical protein